jgi:hypothetical protein
MHVGPMRRASLFDCWSTCLLFKRAKRAPRSPKLSELRQNGVLSMNHPYWYAHAAIRVCIQAHVASQRG